MHVFVEILNSQTHCKKELLVRFCFVKHSLLHCKISNWMIEDCVVAVVVVAVVWQLTESA